MSKPPNPKDTDIVLGKSYLDAIGKARAATATVTELAAQAHAEVREEINPRTGRRESVATVPTALLAEAMNPAWRIQDDGRREMESRLPHETLVGPSGKQERLWAGVSGNAARTRGLRPVWKAGGAKLVTGPNGNLWRLEGKEYVDTGRKRLTRPWCGEGADDSPPTGGIVIH